MHSVHRQNGVALVLVLWITVMLMIMAGAFSLTLQREAKLISNLKAKSEVSAFAEAGLNYAMLMMVLKDPERRWKADGSLHQLPFNDGLVTVSIADESGKIDLNFARRELLVKTFMSVGVELSMADKLADAILDWRDNNDDIQQNGAEKKEYQQQNFPYGPRNAEFKSVEELQFVLGVSPILYRAVEPMLTVYAGKSDVDKTKASAKVLKILEALAEDGGAGLSGKSADSDDSAGSPSLDGENSEDSDLQTLDDADASADSESQAGADDESSGNNSSRSAAGSGTYTVDISALIPSGHTGHIRAVVRPGGNGFALYEILSWKYLTAQNPPLPQDIGQDTSFINFNDLR